MFAPSRHAPPLEKAHYAFTREVIKLLKRPTNMRRALNRFDLDGSSMALWYDVTQSFHDGKYQWIVHNLADEGYSLLDSFGRVERARARFGHALNKLEKTIRKTFAQYKEVYESKNKTELSHGLDVLFRIFHRKKERHVEAFSRFYKRSFFEIDEPQSMFRGQVRSTVLFGHLIREQMTDTPSLPVVDPDVDSVITEFLRTQKITEYVKDDQEDDDTPASVDGRNEETLMDFLDTTLTGLTEYFEQQQRELRRMFVRFEAAYSRIERELRSNSPLSPADAQEQPEKSFEQLEACMESIYHMVDYAYHALLEVFLFEYNVLSEIDMLRAFILSAHRSNLILE